MPFDYSTSIRLRAAVAVVLLAGLGTASDASAQREDIGVNCYAAVDFARNRPFTDLMKTARWFSEIVDPGGVEPPVPLDADGWPTADAQTVVFAGLPNSNGTYAFSCTGRTELEVMGGATVADVRYDPTRDRTTASLRIEDSAADYLLLRFRNTVGGVRDVKLMRPTTQGGTSSYPEDSTFTDDFLALVDRFTLIRSMDLLTTNSNLHEAWSDRVSPSTASFNASAPTVAPIPPEWWQGHGTPWEYVVRLANTAGKDLWINVPAAASADYVRQLALLLRDGSTVDDVFYPGLRADLRLYVEYSNEVWNGLFEQARQNRDAAAAEIAAGASPLSFDGESDPFNTAWRRVGLQTANISMIFRDVFGDSQMMTRIRPILAWQQDDGQASGSLALDFIDRYFGSTRASVPIAHPVNWFVYGGGGSAYYNPDNASHALTSENIWTSLTFDLSRWRTALVNDAHLTIAYGIKRIAYEGGPSLDDRIPPTDEPPTPEADERLRAVKRAAWGDPRMTELLIEHHDLWSEMNGDLIAYMGDAEPSYQWAFVHDVLPPYDTSPKLTAVDALITPGRLPVRPTMGHELTADLRGGEFDRSSPTWLLTAFGGGPVVELETTRAGERAPDWLLYIVRSDEPGSVARTLELEFEGGSADAQVQVRWDGVPLLTAATEVSGSLQIPLTVEPGVHGIMVRAVAGVSRLRRVRLQVETTQVSQVAIGNRHTCALGIGGLVKCWGDNRHGQLGDRTTASRALPLPVLDLPPVEELKTGNDHSCARTAAGEVYCWGWNESGQLGDRTVVDRTSPVPVVGIHAAVEIVAGRQHTCARLASAEVQCWGANGGGQLGNGSSVGSLAPVTVSGLPASVQLVAADANTCALSSVGQVYCWGWNGFGMVGDGTTIPRQSPTEVVGLSGVAEIASGRHHVCARAASGLIHCWGWNQDGALGDHTQTNSSVPLAVVDVTSGARSIAAGSVHTCAALSDRVLCWGANRSHQLGDGTMLGSLEAVEVEGLPAEALSIYARERHSCAVTASGRVYCWGDNERGELGDGTTDNRFVAVPVIGL